MLLQPDRSYSLDKRTYDSFNTASGKCCCNDPYIKNELVFIWRVSIPQAVSAVATAGSRKPVFKRFQKVVLENLKP